jgi:hypothetical protein
MSIAEWLFLTFMVLLPWFGWAAALWNIGTIRQELDLALQANARLV